MLNTFDLPKSFLNDNGTHFSATYVNDFTEKEGFARKFIFVYNTRGNGRVERIVGTIKTASKKMCVENHSDWDNKLPSELR